APALLDKLFYGLAPNVVHDEVRQALVGDAVIVQSDDAVMRENACRLRLLLEAQEARRLRGEVRLQSFNGVVAVEKLMMRQINAAHGAPTQERDYRVLVAEDLTQKGVVRDAHLL